jgi:diguanylate cyclase (GGDEF)-like protein
MPPLSHELCFRYFADILDTLTSTNQHEKVLHLIVDRIARLTRCQTCAIVLIDPATEYLHIDNWHGLSLTFCNQFRRKIATTTIGQLLWTGVPILLTGEEPDQQRAEELKLEHPFRSCVCVQIEIDHRTLGYIHVDSAETNAFTADELKLLQLYADLAGLAINKSRLYDENLHLERIDRETGLEKYVPFLEKLNAAIARSGEFGEHFSLLLMDVDNFKETVKTFGYEASRQLLREMAATIKGKLRPMDAAGRYGFDEFVVLLENSDLEAGTAFAKTILDAISLARYTPLSIRSTVSIGLAACPRNGRAADELILSAKKALFEAQRMGRNNVYAFEAEWHAHRESHPVV